jgi:hypothetical protein
MMAKHNEYNLLLGELYDKTPKAVFAAIAVSSITCGGDYLDEAFDLILKEWKILYQNGIVPQHPPRRLIERND